MRLNKLLTVLMLLFSVVAFSQETTARIGKWTYLKQNETVQDKEFFTTDAWFVLTDYSFSITLNKSERQHDFLIINHMETEEGYFSIVMIEESTGDEALLTFYDDMRFSIVLKDMSAFVGFYYILD